MPRHTPPFIDYREERRAFDFFTCLRFAPPHLLVERVEQLRPWLRPRKPFRDTRAAEPP